MAGKEAQPQPQPGFVESASTTTRNLGIVGAVIGLLAMFEGLILISGAAVIVGEAGRRATKKETVVYQAKPA